MSCSYGDIHKNVNTRLFTQRSPLSILKSKVRMGDVKVPKYLDVGVMASGIWPFNLDIYIIFPVSSPI